MALVVALVLVVVAWVSAGWGFGLEASCSGS